MAEKRQERRGGAAKGVAIFALGATVGSCLALLFAPAPGYVTRKKLATKIRQAQRVAAEKFEERMNIARGWILERMSNGNGKQYARHRTPVHHS